MKRWRSGCDGMISVNSIFASLAAGLLAVIVTLTERSTIVRICVALLLVAFLLFAHAAEIITDAVERDDVLLYQRSHLKYNLGVVLVLISIAFILWSLNYRYLSMIPVVGSWNPWLRDLIWLVRKPDGEWQEYLNSLTARDEDSVNGRVRDVTWTLRQSSIAASAHHRESAPGGSVPARVCRVSVESRDRPARSSRAHAYRP